jgi:hypothetical protein
MIHGSEVQDPRSYPFNVNIVYVTGGKVSEYINYCLQLSFVSL